MIPRFCAYCNRQVGDDGMPVGDPLPKELQKGTHTVCPECRPKQAAELAAAGSFGDFLARKAASSRVVATRRRGVR